MNGEGQLLSDVQILMLIGQICTALQPFRQSAETCCEGERMAGRILQKKKELRNAVVLNAVSAFDPLNVVLNSPHLLLLLWWEG